MLNLSYGSGTPASFETALKDLENIVKFSFKTFSGNVSIGYLVIKKEYPGFKIYHYVNYPKSMKRIEYIRRVGRADNSIS